MSSYVTRETVGDSSWYVHDRFGMFIHFGLASMPAKEFWFKKNAQMTNEEYDSKYFKHFDPDLFDAREWAKMAKNAGMKYVIMTTKHHDGFCLFDSKYTDYNSTKTPFGRDIVREYVDAFRAEGLHIGFYYSLLDHHHPDFTIDVFHPMRFLPQEEVEKLNSTRDMHRYAEYMRNQVTELLTNYGKIDILWLDYTYAKTVKPDRPWLRGKTKDDWESEKLVALARELQPGILINQRAGVEGDLWSYDDVQGSGWLTHPQTGELVNWEALQTQNGYWGYYRESVPKITSEELVKKLIRTVSDGGNCAINVGPTAHGCIEDDEQQSFADIGKWMRFNSRSIYGCTKAEPEFKAPQGTVLTQSTDGKRLYIHLFDYPLERSMSCVRQLDVEYIQYKVLHFNSFPAEVEYMQLLHDKSELRWTMKQHMSEEDINRADYIADKKTQGDLTIELPVTKPNDIVPVIEIFLK